MQELSSMQAAHWVGRSSTAVLGHVAAHLYVEFDGPSLDPERLQTALQRLGRHHPMLRLRVDETGTQDIDISGFLFFDVDDIRALPSEKRTRHLEQKRKTWTTQKLDLAAGQVIAVSLTLLPDGKARLHIDTDMIAIDPRSFLIVMEDLARLYEDDETAAGIASQTGSSTGYFDWLNRVRTNPDRAQKREQDRQWWRTRLSKIPPAPPLLLQTTDGSTTANSDRLAAWLSPEERVRLETTARHGGMTISTLALGLFAAVLGETLKTDQFRLSVPTFWRDPVVDDVETMVGEFSNVLVLSIDCAKPNSYRQLCSQIGAEMIDLLAHSAYPGVNIMRDLSRHHGSMQLSPVVFTSGFGVPGGNLFSERVTRVFGKMGWAISQGAQVALDAQFAPLDDGILINWDIRREALPDDFIQHLFDDYVSLLRTIAQQPEHLDSSLPGLAELVECGKNFAGDTNMDRILKPLQQAYLLGRSEHVALGGVAMQDFREFRGCIDIVSLKNRLFNLVRHHESLRTHIDSSKLIEWTALDTAVNFDVVDLTALSNDDALQKIESLRDDFAHSLFDLSRSPWHITAFTLPASANHTDDNTVIFVRFDALILDGRSISALMATLFDTTEIPAPPTTSSYDVPMDNTKRAHDAAYWEQKLQHVEGAPQLPWKMPLETIKRSRYQRESLLIERDKFARFTRVGARQGLFKNSAITSVILDVLSRWLNEGTLCVGVPVAPQTEGSFANRSSFIAVTWDPKQGDLATRAQALQSDVLEGLEHLAYSGIDISRLLLNSNPGGLALPVVITNALSWPALKKGIPVRQTAGLTQTPQVAMDIRFLLDADGNLIFDIDFAQEAIDSALVRSVLAGFNRAITALSINDTFALNMRDVLGIRNRGFNAPVGDFACSHYLQRIANHLFNAAEDKLALISGDRQISYRELGSAVGKVMAAFKSRDIRKGDVVAICLARSPEHTTVALACALTGAIWVPIDAASPQDRLSYLLGNCKPALIVAANPIAGYEVVAPDALLAQHTPANPSALTLPLATLSSSEDAAYYLYTSGTTGKPKCVVLCNRATSNVIGRTLEAWQVTGRDVFISVTPLHHDMSVFDVFGCLTAGATLVMPQPSEEKDAIRWNQLVEQHGVTLWCSVPAILEMLLACQRSGRELRTLRLVAQGGDYIKPVVVEQLRRLGDHVRLISLGGPTETTIWSIWHEIGPDDTGLVPYGKPLPGNQYFLLNDLGEHCPTHVVGRIHTAGINVALGYLENGILNQTDFITIEDENGASVRAYQTGDRGRYRDDGTILFSSRVNGYVKVRGVRVSLPDIENELAKHPGIQQILVVDYGVEQRGDAAIGALYVPKPQAILTPNDLRSFARQHLPESHIPSRFVAVDALPLSPNGKPDRRQARALIPITNNVAQIAPITGPKDDVLGLYLKVLGKTDNTTADDMTDFISLGLLPSHMKALSDQLRKEFDVAIPVPQLLRCRNAHQVKQLFEHYPRSA